MKKFFSSASTFVRALPVVILFELLFRLIMVAIGAPALTLALPHSSCDHSFSYYIAVPYRTFFLCGTIRTCRMLLMLLRA